MSQSKIPKHLRLPAGETHETLMKKASSQVERRQPIENEALRFSYRTNMYECGFVTGDLSSRDDRTSEFF